MKKKCRYLIPFISMFSLLGACTSPDAGKDRMIKVALPTKAELEVVAQKHIVFGHQSVGRNILEGVAQLAEQANMVIPVIEARQPSPNQQGITHFAVGQNEHPDTKLEDFLRAGSQGAFAGADIATVKFCYVDFSPDTNVQALAQQYIATLQTLQHDYPQTRFVAMTAPLTTVQTGPKAWLKNVLGQAPAGLEANAVRTQFNELLRLHFDEKHIFDVANYEAMAGDTPQIYTYQKLAVQALDPALSEDGGHLNARGMRVVASAFLRFLAQP